MSLESWADSRFLIRHKTSEQEIADLFAIADRDLHDCQTEEISPDWRHNIAYNAALQLAKAALAAAGYKAGRQSHHYYTIFTLEFTVDLDKDSIDLLNVHRSKRAVSDYDRMGTISETDVEDMIELAENLRHKVDQWIRSNHPHLLK